MIQTKNLPIYKINLQHFFKHKIARVAHNGYGHAVYDRHNFVMGFLETMGLKVIKYHQNVDIFWIWAKADDRYSLTHELIEFGQLVETVKDDEKG